MYRVVEGLVKQLIPEPRHKDPQRGGVELLPLSGESSLGWGVGWSR